jgi:DNA-directed RNA polymerase subunit F
MIKKSTPLTLAETNDLISKDKKQEKIRSFSKHFSKTSLTKVNDMKKELSGLNLLKLKPEHIVKIIDFLPEDASDLTKIVSEVSFDQDEVNKILEVVRKY